MLADFGSVGFRTQPNPPADSGDGAPTAYIALSPIVRNHRSAMAYDSRWLAPDRQSVREERLMLMEMLLEPLGIIS